MSSQCVFGKERADDLNAFMLHRGHIFAFTLRCPVHNYNDPMLTVLHCTLVVKSRLSNGCVSDIEMEEQDVIDKFQSLGLILEESPECACHAYLDDYCLMTAV